MTIMLKKNGQMIIDPAPPLEGKDANLDNLAAFIADPQDGNAIVYNATKGVWEAGEVSGGGSMESLSDVDISEPTDGQTLVYNATSEKWENGSGGGGMVVEINTVDDEMVMNHTWKEIHDALPVMPVTVFLELDGEYKQGNIVSVEETEDGGRPVYIASAAVWMSGQYDAVDFTTDSDDGYPSAQ